MLGGGALGVVRESRRRLKRGKEAVLITAELWGEWEPNPQEGRRGEGTYS